jgi:hypothetical protein
MKPGQQAVREQRATARRRTRLRSGKILDPDNRFLVECVVHDRSAEGARLRIVADLALTSPVRLFDDEQGTLHEVSIVWRRGQEIGVRYVGSGTASLTEAQLRQLRGKYYALSK